MRRAAKIDRNQPEIVNALRLAGASVQLLHSVGEGCPDILIGYRGVNILAEIKDHEASNTDRKLRPRQVEWHAAWRGQAAVIETVGQALALIGLKPLA